MTETGFTNYPNNTKNDQNDKNDSRSATNTLKVALKVNSVGTLNLNIRIGDLARRTARSALNNIIIMAIVICIICITMY